MDTPVGYQSFVLYVTMSFCAMSPPDLLYVMILRELPSREIDFWSKSKVTYISAILYIDLWHGDKNQSISQSIKWFISDNKGPYILYRQSETDQYI